MVTLLIGKKGTGKTKKLISLANEAVATSAGNVVVIEKGAKLTFDVTHKARLIDTDQYEVQGYDVLYGFVCGICAGNYDVIQPSRFAARILHCLMSLLRSSALWLKRQKQILLCSSRLMKQSFPRILSHTLSIFNQ